MEKFLDVNSKGHSIRCKIYTHDLLHIKKMVLYGHGFGGHRDNRAAARFADRILTKYKNIAVMTFDLPCHGDDVKKKLNLSDCDEYITLILQYIKDRFHTEDVYVYATSFGSYLFLKYIHDHGNVFHKLALRGPAINIYESMTNRIISNDDMEKLEKGKDALVGFDRKVRVNMQFLNDLHDADIRTYDYIDYADDILIMQGTKDEIISTDVVSEFAEQNVIEMVMIEHADHRFQNPLAMDKAIQCILDFYQF